MNIVFKSKNKAFEYYNTYNKHMRQINVHGNTCSDWDPNTYLRYIVREYYGEHLSIDPFNKDDRPIVKEENGSISTTYGPHNKKTGKKSKDNEDEDNE
jgi:hypothetical protein